LGFSSEVNLMNLFLRLASSLTDEIKRAAFLLIHIFLLKNNFIESPFDDIG
jgi:hypothetical protein